MKLLRFGLLFAMMVLLSSVAAWTVGSSQAYTLSPQPAPTYGKPFAVAEIVKPTYTPSPTATSTSTPPPPPLPTETSQPMVQAVIVDSPERTNAAPAPINYTGGKYILVDISEQHMYVYDTDQLVFSFVASTGMNNATRTGRFSVLDKIPNAYGATWNIWMPNWLGIYYAGSLENGIHALPILSNGATLWAGFLGRPISYGCIVLDTSDSLLLYDWAEVGVPVEIQW